MNERKRKMSKERIEEALELCRMLDEDIAVADWFGCSEDTVSYITNSRIFLKDLLHDLRLGDDEIESVRLMWRCERHGGHDPETHCYPCHTENLIKAEAANAALVEALEIDPEELARLFHEVYEAQAPMFGYETKPETRCQWADMPEDNKRLMISVCTRIIGVLKVRTALEKR